MSRGVDFVFVPQLDSPSLAALDLQEHRKSADGMYSVTPSAATKRSSFRFSDDQQVLSAMPASQALWHNKP